MDCSALSSEDGRNFCLRVPTIDKGSLTTRQGICDTEFIFEFTVGGTKHSLYVCFDVMGMPRLVK